MVGPKCTMTKYVACCPLVSHGEYADGTDRQTDRQTDGRQNVTNYDFRYGHTQRNNAIWC